MIWKYPFSIGDKEVLLTDNTEPGLFRKVKKHFKDNKIAFNEVSLRRAILRMNTIDSKKGKFTIKEVISGAHAMLKRVVGDNVSNEEMQRRSAICSNCPHRTTVSDCLQCGGSKRMAQAINTFRTARKLESEIPEKVKTKYCSICSCSLALMVATKFEDLAPEDPAKNASRPDYCWLKKN